MKELSFRDDIAIVYPFPRKVKMTVILGEQVTLIERSERVRESDVLLAYRKAMLYRYKTGVWPNVIIKALEAEKEALELAEELGIKIELSDGDNN